MLITPKNAIEIVLARKTKDARFRLYETTAQKWFFWLSVGGLGAGFILAFITYFWKYQFVVVAALIALLLSSLLAVAYQVAAVLPELTKLRNIEREISNPLLIEFNNDLDLINELAQNYEPHHLSYAKTNYVLMAKQLRERISILVGAIDKVGAIPLAITGYLSFSKAQKEGFVALDGIEWILIAFLFLYLLALRMTLTAQWMEKVSEVYEQAIVLRLKRES